MIQSLQNSYAAIRKLSESFEYQMTDSEMERLHEAIDEARNEYSIGRNKRVCWGRRRARTEWKITVDSKGTFLKPGKKGRVLGKGKSKTAYAGIHFDKLKPIVILKISAEKENSQTGLRGFTPSQSHHFLRETMIAESLEGQKNIGGLLSTGTYLGSSKGRGAERFEMIVEPAIDNLCDWTINRISNNKGTNPNELIQIMVDMAEGVRQLHQMNYAHRDIKPDNFLVIKDNSDRPRVKLWDFEFCINGSDLEEFKTIRGTHSYIAHECYLRKSVDKNPYENLIDAQKIDIYALGISIGCIVTGEMHPLQDFYSKVHHYFEKHPDCLDRHQVLSNFSESCYEEASRYMLTQNTQFTDLIKLMTHRDSQKRPSIQEVCIILKDIQKHMLISNSNIVKA